MNDHTTAATAALPAPTTAPRLRRHRTVAGLLIGAAAVSGLTACGGGGTPSRDEFIAEMRDTLGRDLTEGAGIEGVDTDTLRDLVDDFLGCTYDAIEPDEELLKQMYRDPSFSTATTGSSDRSVAFRARVDELSRDCVSELNNSANQVLSGEETP